METHSPIEPLRIPAQSRKNKVDSLGTACDYRRNQLAEPCLGVLLCWTRAFVQKSKSVLNTCGSSRSRTHKECRHPFTTSTPKNGLRPRIRRDDRTRQTESGNIRRGL